MQPLSYSFACHVGCKVKYFGKVANVVGIRGEDMCFAALSFHEPNQLSAENRCGS